MLHIKFRYILLTVISVVICYFSFFYYEIRTEKEIAQLLGIEEALIVSTDYTFYPFISLRDGDTMEVYHLSNSTIKNFMSNSSFELYDDFYESHSWMKENWHKCPIDLAKSSQECVTAFAPRAGANKKFASWAEENIKLLSSTHAYYAFYYKNDDIVFFVLDVIYGKLYITTVYM